MLDSVHDLPRSRSKVALRDLRSAHNLERSTQCHLVLLIACSCDSYDRQFAGAAASRTPEGSQPRRRPRPPGAPGERAQRPQSWGILRRARCCPASIGKLARAIHVLQLQGTALTCGTGKAHCYHASAKRPSRVQRSHDGTGEHDHMADTILTESEASLAVEDLGWRYLLDRLTTAVAVGSLSGACEVIRAAVGIAGPHADGHLRLRATACEWSDAETRGKFRVTTQDVDLARSITKAVRAAGRPDGRAPCSSFGSVACNRDRCDGHPRSAPVLEGGLGMNEAHRPPT